MFAQSALDIITKMQTSARGISERYTGSLQVFAPKHEIKTKNWIYKRFGQYPNSRAFLQFTAPAEIKNTALLVIRHSDKPTEAWLWIPAEERDRHISLQNHSTRFFGTDFTFEDLENLEERRIEENDYKLIGEEVINNVVCWKIESHPKQAKVSQYTSATLWISKEHYILIRVDNFNKEKLIRQLNYNDIQRLDGVWTSRYVEVLDTVRNSRTVLKLESVEYNVKMSNEEFTREALRQVK